jgi:hypothetical protein
MCIKTKNLPRLGSIFPDTELVLFYKDIINNNDTFFIKHKEGTKHKIIHLLDFGDTIELFEINHL